MREEFKVFLQKSLHQPQVALITSTIESPNEISELINVKNNVKFNCMYKLNMFNIKFSFKSKLRRLYQEARSLPLSAGINVLDFVSNI